MDTARSWHKLVLLAALVFVPVPTLTASGLAVPLPSVVYRAAVGLAERTQEVVVKLPGFEPVVDESKDAARAGVIRQSAAEIGRTPASTPVANRTSVPASGKAGGSATSQAEKNEAPATGSNENTSSGGGQDPTPGNDPVRGVPAGSSSSEERTETPPPPPPPPPPDRPPLLPPPPPPPPLPPPPPIIQLPQLPRLPELPLLPPPPPPGSGGLPLIPR